MSSDSKLSFSPRDISWGKPIGEGGFGVVREGEYVVDSRKCAVKILKSTGAPRDDASVAIKAAMETELELLIQLRSEFLLLPEALGTSSSGDPMILTQYAEFGDMDKYLATRHWSAVPLERRLDFALQVAQGMAYVHSKNPRILHLDLKPSNILICKGEMAKIADFGIAKVIQEEGQVHAHCLTGSIQYASPEAIVPKKELVPGKGVPGLTFKSDVFSYGMVLYQLFTGRRPFERELTKLTEQHQGLDFFTLRAQQPELLPSLDDPPAWMPESIWQKLKKLMLACWKIDPHERPNFKGVIASIYEIHAIFENDRDNYYAFMETVRQQQNIQKQQTEAAGLVAGSSNRPGNSGAQGRSSLLSIPSLSPFIDGPGISFVTSITNSQWQENLAEQERGWLEALFSTSGARRSAEGVIASGSSEEDGCGVAGASDSMSTARSTGSSSVASGAAPGTASGSGSFSRDGAVEWPASTALEVLGRHLSTSKLARRMAHALAWLVDNSCRHGGEVVLSCDDLLSLAQSINGCWKGWDPQDFDALHLTFTAVDWLLGTWAAMEYAAKAGGPAPDCEQLMKALERSMEQVTLGVSSNGSVSLSEQLKTPGAVMDDQDKEDIRAAAEESRDQFQLTNILQRLKEKAGSTTTTRHPAERISSLEQASKEYLEKRATQQQLQLQDQLEREWTEELDNEITFAKELKSKMSDDEYPEAMFIEPIKVDLQDRARLFTAMKKMWRFWRAVINHDKAGLLPESFWARHWINRATIYRLLFEPVDIANWYFGDNKHWKLRELCNCTRKDLCYCKDEGYHYAKGIETEEDEVDMTKDNNRRPGRYMLLQKKEKDFNGRTPKSTVAVARRLAKRFGNQTWEAVIGKEQGAAEAGVGGGK